MPSRVKGMGDDNMLHAWGGIMDTVLCYIYQSVWQCVLYIYYTYIMPTSIRSRIYSVGDIASHSITCLRSVPVSGRHPDMSWWYPLIIYDIPFIEFLSPFTIQHFPKFPSFFQCFLGVFLSKWWICWSWSFTQYIQIHFCWPSELGEPPNDSHLDLSGHLRGPRRPGGGVGIWKRHFPSCHNFGVYPSDTHTW